MVRTKRSSQFEKQVKFVVSNPKRFVKWLITTKSHAIAHLPDKENLIWLVWKRCFHLLILLLKSKNLQNKIISIPEFRQENKWMTLLDKLSISSLSQLSMTHISLFQMLAQELILRDKVYQPYWTPVYKDLSEKLLSHIEIDSHDLDLSLSNSSLRNAEEKSLSLMTKKTKVVNKNLQRTYYQLSTSTVVNKWVNEATSQEKIVKSVKIPLQKNLKAQMIINEWINTSNYVYNKTVEAVYNGEKRHFETLRNKLVTFNTKKNNIEYLKHTEQISTLSKQKSDILKEYVKEAKLNIDKDVLKNKYEKELNQSIEIDNEIAKLKQEFSIVKKTLTAEQNTQIHDWELNTPKEIRAGAVNDVCKAYKTGFENLKQGNIRHFRLGFRKKRNPKKTILIQKNLISVKNGEISIAPKFTNGQCIFQMGKKTFKKHRNIEVNHDVRLVKEHNKYWLHIPVKVDVKPKQVPESYCGIDPGVKTFMTLFTDSGLIEYKQDHSILDKLNNKIDKLKSLRRHGIKKKIVKLEQTKTNVVDEIHWKTINDILQTNDVIFYGDIKSHSIVKDNQNHVLNRNMNDLKFYKFKKKLEYKCSVENKLLYIVPENHTTKCCSSCGNIYEIGLSRVYNCSKCGLVMGRDINSGKNILMKGIVLNNL